MKKYSFTLFALFCLILVACNKDEVISGPVPEPETVLNYKVIEYLPAPGQFINEKVTGFDDIATMAKACETAQIRLQQNQYVSLGAWGGYIVIKLDKSIPNIGGYNFAISGNSFDSSNEPGIVWVMEDINANGLPDDTWYELRGSYYGEDGYQQNYWVTYYRPEAGKDTYWKDSNGDEGYVKWMGGYHEQDFYYPNWVIEDSYTLKGSKLPSRAQQNPVTGIWENLPYEWGYVDNNGKDLISIDINGKTIEANSFRISDAMDENGKSVVLNSIDFIKVQTAIMGSSGILGENSTEVTGFFAIH